MIRINSTMDANYRCSSLGVRRPTRNATTRRYRDDRHVEHPLPVRSSLPPTPSQPELGTCRSPLPTVQKRLTLTFNSFSGIVYFVHAPRVEVPAVFPPVILHDLLHAHERRTVLSIPLVAVSEHRQPGEHRPHPVFFPDVIGPRPEALLAAQEGVVRAFVSHRLSVHEVSISIVVKGDGQYVKGWSVAWPGCHGWISRGAGQFFMYAMNDHQHIHAYSRIFRL